MPLPSSANPRTPMPPRRLHGPRWAHTALTLGLLLGALACRAPAPAPRPAAPRPSSDQREQVMRRCLRERQERMEGLRELRRAEAALAELNAVLLSPPGAPRPVWDEEKEQRFSREDQLLDRQRYEQELAAWRQRRDAWQAQQSGPLAQAQERLDRQTRLLHQRYPTLFTGSDSIELDPRELERLNRCPPVSG